MSRPFAFWKVVRTGARALAIGSTIGASWFETRGVAALLTMRVWHCATHDHLILRSRAAASRRIGHDKNTATPSHSRGALAPESCITTTTLREIQRAQGRPGGRCTRGPRAKQIAQRARDHRYRRRHSGLPCAVVYGLLRALLGEPGVCHRRRRETSVSRRLGACIGAPGPHDFAVRICAARQSACLRPPHPASRFVTFATRPSCRGGTGEEVQVICPTAQADGMRQINATGKADSRVARRIPPFRRNCTRHLLLHPNWT